MAGSDTKERILDAAERLFAEHTYAGVSLRTITAEANVNLAAVNYHFGSKDALLQAVFHRRARDLNRERVSLLAEIEARAGGRPLPLDDVLYALLAPPMRWMSDPERGLSVFVQFLARCRADGTPEMKALLDRDVRHLHRFVTALQKALPQLAAEEIYWRLHFSLGMMHYTITDLSRLEAISQGVCDLEDFEALIRRMVAFAAAGFRNAPPLREIPAFAIGQTAAGGVAGIQAGMDDERGARQGAQD